MDDPTPRGSQRSPGSETSTIRDQLADGPIVIITLPPSGDVEFVVIPRRVLGTLCVLIAVLLVLSTAGQATVHYLPDFPARDAAASLFFVDSEQSFPTLLSTLLLLGSAMTAWVIARGSRQRRRPFVRHWAILALILAAMTVDEALSIHERTIDPLRRLMNIEGGPLWFAWVVPGAVVAGLVGIAYLRFVTHLPRLTRRRIVAASILYLGGAIGLELVGGWYISDQGETNMTAVAILTVEEALEMLGLAVLVDALLAHVAQHMPRAGVRLRAAP